MQYDFSAFDTKAKDIFEWLQTEYAGIRAGRATPQLLDSVRVSAYGAMSAMNQVASVTVEEARTLRVSVWDASLVKAVEKALIEADLGVSVVVDGNGMRVMFPELSSERREQLMKLAKTKLEEARISIRGLRDDENKKIVAELPGEDDARRAKETLQKKVDEANGKLADMFALKEKEMSI
ncbi:ribosome recycling factor [Candidatus Kaiserbacteria bacterium RIFCSPHIGHO2_02_FULL_50_50]|uniref:Ribosome recycling factor n=1 Tax=Candidatus Kaiserbacteria bacterium RIFCSPHIGHO2_02_FULL_50_50 TaxID=1798492 RepID=A0A1F6DGJ3_9BACT|nr:MAG: ribosome recycling factor [Candidatus Kaiserbacteria bacterium RIFCSPHIGHO2_02_FULL_50_50]OGG88281.1 MAG: ribosome recycling factor [Candidatus Kaiserbacteria bacterium RIFCSPLOWO2_12_FULL_50_10]